MFIAGNWKMNTDLQAAARLAADVLEAVGSEETVRVAVCPPAVSLDTVFSTLRGSRVALGAQNMHEADSGAFTGEISAPMLRSVGCDYVILGHSERRQYFGETDESVNAKVLQALRHDLVPILCVGETLEERDAGREQEVVRGQLQGGLERVTLENADSLVVAYEPVWAIGTGRTATSEQAQEMHAFIRGVLREQFREGLSREIHILYGGSLKPDNADELLGCGDVDGGLIGGASLKAGDFAAIVRAGAKHTRR
jgi:triosephosphate isomerase (TIM)